MSEAAPENYEVMAPWDVEPRGLARIMELWGFDQSLFDEFMKIYRLEWILKHGQPGTDYERAQLKGDAIVAIIRQAAEKFNGMPKPIMDFCGIKNEKAIAEKFGVEPEDLIWDPARITYRFLQEEGFKVWIPVD